MRSGKRVIAALFLGTSLLLAGCGAAEGSSPKSYGATEEEIAAAMEKMSDDIEGLDFSFDGEVYSLPIKAGVFMELGWAFPEDFLKKIDPYPAMTEWGNCSLIKMDGDKEMELGTITLLNTSEEECAVEDVYITNISFDRYDIPNMIFPKGITWASSIEDVKEAFGTPDSEGSAGSEDTFINTRIIYSTNSCSMTFSFQTMDGVTKMTGVMMSYNKTQEYSVPGA